MAAARTTFVWPRDRLDDARFAEDITFEEVVSTTFADPGTAMEWESSSGFSSFGADNKEAEMKLPGCTEESTEEGTEESTEENAKQSKKETDIEGDPAELFSGTLQSPPPDGSLPKGSEGGFPFSQLMSADPAEGDPGTDSDDDSAQDGDLEDILRRAREATAADKERLEIERRHREELAAARKKLAALEKIKAERESAKAAKIAKAAQAKAKEAKAVAKAAKTGAADAATTSSTTSKPAKEKRDSSSSSHKRRAHSPDSAKASSSKKSKASRQSSENVSPPTARSSTSEAKLARKSSENVTPPTARSSTLESKAARKSTENVSPPAARSSTSESKGSRKSIENVTPLAPRSSKSSLPKSRKTVDAGPSTSTADPTPSPSKKSSSRRNAKEVPDTSRFKVMDCLTPSQMQREAKKKSPGRRSLAFKCPYCNEVARQRDGLTDHLTTDHAAEVSDEIRGIQGAQSRAVNISTSGPRVMDESAFSVLLSRLRPLMSAKAFQITTSALKQAIARMTGYIGRSDVVNLNPYADYVSFLETAMVDGDLFAVEQDDQSEESGEDNQDEERSEEDSSEEHQEDEEEGSEDLDDVRGDDGSNSEDDSD